LSCCLHTIQLNADAEKGEGGVAELAFHIAVACAGEVGNAAHNAYDAHIDEVETPRRTLRSYGLL
jgi:hypothetical protein